MNLIFVELIRWFCVTMETSSHIVLWYCHEHRKCKTAFNQSQNKDVTQSVVCYLKFESFPTESIAWNIYQEPTFQDSQLMLMLTRNIVFLLLLLRHLSDIGVDSHKSSTMYVYAVQ